jgi:hypothetical protein
MTKKDPEKMKQDMETLESDRLRAQRRLESARRTQQEKYHMTLTESYLEGESDHEDFDEMEEEKNSFEKKKKKNTRERRGLGFVTRTVQFFFFYFGDDT